MSVRMGNFSPVDRDERNTTKMVEHKLVSFAAVAALWTLVTLLIKLIRLWKYKQEKNYAILAAMLRKRSYFVKKVSSRAEVFIWENCHPGYRDLGRKNRNLGNGAGFSYEHIEIFTRIEWRGEISETEPARSTGLT